MSGWRPSEVGVEGSRSTAKLFQNSPTRNPGAPRGYTPWRILLPRRFNGYTGLMHVLMAILD